MSQNNDTDLIKLDQQICFSLYSASNAMVRIYRPELDKIGLTYLQYIVMMVLWEQDGISITGIGNKLHLDSGTLTPLLKRLETKGLLKRQLSLQDERIKLIRLTDQGTLLKQQACAIPERILCGIPLPLKDLQTLKKQCDALIQTLQNKM